MSAAEQLARRLADDAMERYAEGSNAAFHDLYDMLEPRLRRFVTNRAGSRDLVDDVIQMTLLAARTGRVRTR